MAESGQKYGTAVLTPSQATAGERGRWEISYTVGESGIAEGGAIRVVPPHHQAFWDVGKVRAYTSVQGISLEVSGDKTHPQSLHHSHYPAVLVEVFGGALSCGDEIHVIFGDIGGYNSGRFIQARAQTHTCKNDFEVWLDHKGNGRFSLERLRQETWKRVPGDLTIDVQPNCPDQIRVSLRAPGEKGGEITGVVSVEDRFENPCTGFEGEIALKTEWGAAPELDQSLFLSEGNGKFSISGGKLEFPLILSAADWKSGAYGVSNCLAPDFLDDYQIYFGDLHVMTGSCGNPGMLGSTGYALRYARDVMGLDFSAVTNTGGNRRWDEEKEIFKRYNEPGRFVTMPAYERGSRRGHKNVYFLDEERNPTFPQSTPEELFENLSGEVMVISHHTNTHSETDPDNWGPHDLDSIDTRWERVIEITQNRGSFEKDEIGDGVYFGGFGSSVQDALAKGYRLGFVGGTDNHRARPGSGLSDQSGLDASSFVSGGITCVLAEERTREAIWRAIWDRRCYASTGPRLLLDVRVNGSYMGQEITRGDSAAEIAVRVISRHEVQAVDIVKNNSTVHTAELREKRCAEFRWMDPDSIQGDDGGLYYYVRVRFENGHKAWSSPVWLD